MQSPLIVSKTMETDHKNSSSYVRRVLRGAVMCCGLLISSWILAHFFPRTREIVTDWEQALAPRGTIVSTRGVRLSNEFRNLRHWMNTVDKFPNDPPPVKAEQLVQILDAISPHPAQFSTDIQFARAGIDPWGRKMHCRVTSTDPHIAEIVIWSDGSNRRDDGGDHDDILVRLVWAYDFVYTIRPEAKNGRRTGVRSH